MPQTIPNRYRDLNLSFLPNPIRKDISTLSDVDAVRQSVMNLILTKHYERPFHPEIGCNVTKLLFDNLTSITALMIKRSIQDVIQNFEPRVNLISVDVIANFDGNGYDVTIAFFVLNVRDAVTVDFFLERLR
jgi:phage baseplate assembly protein W